MRHDVVPQLVLVEAARRDRKVVHRLLGRKAEAERDVTELQVEVDHEHLLPRERERRGEIRGSEGLARTALRAEHADEPAVLAPALVDAVRRVPRDRDAHREAELLLRLREDRHVVGSRLERAPEEPVRRGRGEHDDRHVGRGAVRAVDDVQRAIVLAPLAGDDDEVRLVLEQRSDGFLDALGQRDEAEARVVRERSLDVERVEAFDCYECADRAIHGSPYRFVWLVMSCWICCVVIAFLGGSFAFPAGRRRNHKVPLLDASAIV
jgi:hypothetical protein